MKIPAPRVKLTEQMRAIDQSLGNQVAHAALRLPDSVAPKSEAFISSARCFSIGVGQTPQPLASLRSLKVFRISDGTKRILLRRSRKRASG